MEEKCNNAQVRTKSGEKNEKQSSRGLKQNVWWKNENLFEKFKYMNMKKSKEDNCMNK